MLAWFYNSYSAPTSCVILGQLLKNSPNNSLLITYHILNPWKQLELLLKKNKLFTYRKAEKKHYLKKLLTLVTVSSKKEETIL